MYVWCYKDDRAKEEGLENPNVEHGSRIVSGSCCLNSMAV